MRSGRRASGAANHVPSTSSLNSSTTRIHRPNESQHAFPPPHVASSASSYKGPVATPQQGLITILVNRLKQKLPCHAGGSIMDLEADEGIQQMIESVRELAKDFPDFIAWTLASLLDHLAQRGDFSIAMLQSQLFVLKVLSVALASRWPALEVSSRPVTRNDEYSGSGFNTPIEASSPTSARPPRTRPSRETIGTIGSAQTISPELPALNEDCAKYVLSVMVLYVRQTAPSEGSELETTLSHHNFDVDDELRLPSIPDASLSSPSKSTPSINHPLRSRESNASFGSTNVRPISATPIPPEARTYTNTVASMAVTVSSLNSLVSKFAGIVIYHISASNWPVVFERVRAKIRALEKVERGAMPDTIDLQLMTQCALDRSRLVQLLQEVSSLYLSMKRDAQIVLAVPLAAAVWHWIDLYPEEFSDSVAAPRRLEGAPERVFDLIYRDTQSENRYLLWPTLTVLMCISHERVNQDFILDVGGGARKTNKKEVILVGGLVKNTFSNQNRLSAVALRCLLDIGKAASTINMKGEIPIRGLAFDLAHEVKNALLNHPGRRPFWESNDEIDVGIYSDAFVMLWRFLPEHESLPVFHTCLQAERSDAVKLCVVAGMQTLAREAQVYPGTRPPFNLWKEMSDRIRIVFQAATSRKGEMEDGIARRPAARPLSKGHANQRLTDRELLMIAVLALWRADITTYFMGLPDIVTADVTSPIGTAIWDSANESVVKLAMTRSFKFLVDTAFIMDPQSPFIERVETLLPKLTPLFIFTAGSYLFHSRIDFEAQEMWITSLIELLKTYTRRSPYSHIELVKQSPGRIPAFLVSEIILLVSLTSVNNKVSVAAAQALRVLAQAEQGTGVQYQDVTGEDEGALRLQVYEQLGNKVNFTGRVGYQKRMRTLVGRLATATPSHFAVWQECYFRWIEITNHYHSSLGKGFEDGRSAILGTSIPQDDLHQQWRNLTLFLAAFGASCTPDEPYDHEALAEYIPMEYLPDTVKTLMNPDYLVDDFIERVVYQLIENNVAVRDVAREALGTELCAKLYPKLYKQLEKIIAEIAAAQGVKWSEQYYIFLDQFVTLFKMLLENISTSTFDDRIDSSFGDTLLNLAGFIGQFNHENGPARVRVKFASLIELAARLVDPSGIVRRETFSRHEILDMLANWVKSPFAVDPEYMAVQKELNMTCMRAIVNILERCPSPPDNGARGDELQNHYTRFGFRYFELLQSLLTYSTTEREDDGVSTRTSQSQRNKGIKGDAECYELAVAGMVHVLSANVANLYKHMVKRAFADPDQRALFIRVCARVVRKQVNLEQNIAPKAITSRQRLTDLVRRPNLTLAIAICETCPPSDVEKIIPVLFNIFDTRPALMELLKIMINREIQNTDSEAELFRSNSMCTRMLSHFGKIHGYAYLRHLIGHLVASMANAPPDCQYEINPAYVGEERSQENIETTKMIATAFLDIIQPSVSALPSMFREICAHIANRVQMHYPEAKFAALGSFIFLRFISPAIVAPDQVDIKVPQDDTGNFRRGLMLIAKIIQNLANNIFFGKEAHLTVLNEYLRENIVTVTRYLSELNKYVPPPPSEAENEWLGTTCDESDVLVLHRFFASHIDKIGKEILSIEKSQENEGVTPGPSLWGDLCSAMVELSDPSEVPKLATESSTEHGPWRELVERFYDRPTAAVANIFVEAVTDKDEPALFVLSMHSIDVETLDIDLLMYHILTTLSGATQRQRRFEVIFDFTSFTASSEIPLQWIKFCIEVIPADIRARFAHARILNPNQVAQRYLRRLYNVAGAISSSAEVTQYTTVEELHTQLPSSINAPLKAATELEEEEYHHFTDVGMRQVSQMRLHGDIRIGTSHLRITSLKAQTVSSSLSLRTVDIIDLADVSDVYNVSMSHEGYEFIVRQRQGSTIYFNSQDRDAIVKAIKDARGKLRQERPTGSRGAKLQSNMHASLIRIGLSNAGNGDYDLRIASMELLGNVCDTLKVEDAMDVATRAIVPYNPSVFVVSVSERLAGALTYLTMDFVSEVCMNLSDLKVRERLESIQFLSPWIVNLQKFCDPTHALYEGSGARLRDTVRTLVDLTTNDSDLVPMFQKHIWGEIAKADQAFIFIVLDELMRAAVDAGVSSERCEIIGQTIATISTLNVRGRLFAKLRKVFSRTTMKATQTLVENAQWGEIAALTYLVLASSVHFKHPSQVQFYLPEIVNLVTHVAATGELLVRRTVHAIVVNLIQSMQHFVSDGSPLRATYVQLLQESEDPHLLQAFGLRKHHAQGDLLEWNPPGGITPANDIIALNLREDLTRFLVKIMEAASGSTGVLNSWRARWMGLVTATSFQHSPCIQARTFAVIGVLATGDVDDDLLYQMLVAFKQGLAQSDESRTAAVVSMLRCITQVVPLLPRDSRYLAQLFWLGFALVQSSALPFYEEATRLMQQALETLDRHGTFDNRSVSQVLVEARMALGDVPDQLDAMLGLYFHYLPATSFSIAAPIFKGIQVESLQKSAKSILRCLLRIATTSAVKRRAVGAEDSQGMTPVAESTRTVDLDALGYFLALLPSSTTREGFGELLKDAQLSEAWAHEFSGLVENPVPRVHLELLGLQERHWALAVTTFLGVMLGKSPMDGGECEILFVLLADVAEHFPEQVALAYFRFQDKVKDSFSMSVNSRILGAASCVFQVSIQDSQRHPLSRPSASTLNTINEYGTDMNGLGGKQLSQLDEMGLPGLVQEFQFLPQGHRDLTTLMRWIPDLVQRIIGAQ